MMTQHDDRQPVDEEEVADHMFDADNLIGVRMVRDADPAARASELAEELGGEIVRDVQHAERAFTARAEAGRAEPTVLSDTERAELESLAAGHGTAPAGVDDATVEELQRLADELAMTERIRSNTETSFTESLGARLSAASAVAVHPTAIRQAAATLTEVEARVATYDASLEQLGPRPSEIAPTAEEDTAALPDMFDEAGLERNRRSGALAIVVLLVFGGAGAALLIAGAALPIPIAVFAVGLVLAGFLLTRKRARQPDRVGEREASDLLASATADADDADLEPEPEPPTNDDEWLGRRAHLDALREAAVERMRSARAHWESLVGPDADPHEVDELLRVRDPQFELIGAASKTSPTVRTVSAVHRTALARWRVAWAAVGYDEPPSLDGVDEHLARLTTARALDPDDARARLLAAQTWSDACAAIDRPIVLLEPEHWLPAQRLEQMVSVLPAGAEVIVVVSDADPADSEQ
jgi:hypothetical protein